MIKDNNYEFKIQKDYECIECKYKTKLNFDFKKHLLTAKHKRLSEDNEKIIKRFICICGKEYKDRHSLSRHKKCCTFKEETITDKTITDKEEIKSNLLYNISSIIEIIKQNNEFKELLIQQNKQIQEQNKQIQENNKEQFLLINKFIEILNKG